MNNPIYHRKLIKTGASLALTLPAALSHKFQLKNHDRIVLTAHDGFIMLTPINQSIQPQPKEQHNAQQA